LKIKPFANFSNGRVSSNLSHHYLMQHGKEQLKERVLAWGEFQISIVAAGEIKRSLTRSEKRCNPHAIVCITVVILIFGK
jgi:hypothetical protein